MQNERRNKQEYDYNQLVKLLNDDQRRALRQVEQFGWELHFVRKPLFMDVVPVVINADGRSIGVLEGDGRINMEPDLDIRASA